MENKITLLDQKIKEAGIPIHGIGKDNGVLRIDFKDEATSEQRTEAQAISDGFDFKPRMKRSLLKIHDEIKALSQDEKDNVLFITAAYILRELEPELLKKYINIDILGDEPQT